MTCHGSTAIEVEINGNAAPGYSSGQAQAAIEKLLKDELPNGMTYEWTDLTYQQILSGNTALFVFPLCVLLAFLVLAAQYESWSLPLAVTTRKARSARAMGRARRGTRPIAVAG